MKCRRSTFGFSVPIEFEFDCIVWFASFWHWHEVVLCMNTTGNIIRSEIKIPRETILYVLIIS